MTEQLQQQQQIQQQGDIRRLLRPRKPSQLPGATGKAAVTKTAASKPASTQPAATETAIQKEQRRRRLSDESVKRTAKQAEPSKRQHRSDSPSIESVEPVEPIQTAAKPVARKPATRTARATAASASAFTSTSTASRQTRSARAAITVAATAAATAATADVAPPVPTISTHAAGAMTPPASEITLPSSPPLPPVDVDDSVVDKLHVPPSAADLFSRVQEAREEMDDRRSEAATSPQRPAIIAPIVTSTAAPPSTEERAAQLLPGYQRFKRQPVPAVRAQLPLPPHHARLYSIFEALDHTAAFTRARNNVVAFHRIKPAVEGISRRTFELVHLAQIVALYPEAYTLSAERITHDGKRIDTVLIDIPMAASGDDDGDGDGDAVLPFASRFASVRQQRRDTFRDRLIAHVAESHNAFLAAKSLAPVAGRWHPQFSLENVPEPTAAELLKPAQPPPAALTRDRLDNLLQRVRGGQSPAVQTAGPSTLTTADTVTPATATRALSLLERIKAKEAAANAAAAAAIQAGISPEDTRERNMRGRLPGLINSISFLFYAAKRTVIPLSEVAAKLVDSNQTPMSAKEAIDHIRLLAKLVPQWIKLESSTKTAATANAAATNAASSATSAVISSAVALEEDGESKSKKQSDDLVRIDRGISARAATALLAKIP